jgi:hypothetical protein
MKDYRFCQFSEANGQELFESVNETLSRASSERGTLRQTRAGVRWAAPTPVTVAVKFNYPCRTTQVEYRTTHNV